MPNDLNPALSMFAAVAAFGLVLSLWLMGVLIWFSRRRRRATQVQDRLDYARAAAPHAAAGRVLGLWHDGKEATTVVPGLGPEGMLVRLERMRCAAGVETPLATALPMLAGTLLLIIGVAYIIASSLVIALLVSPLAVLVVIWIDLSRRISKRTRTFERQFVDALELAARSLRAGHPLIGSFRLISEEIAAPVGSLFAEVCQQQALGLSMENALRGLGEENHSEDLKLFVTSVAIQLSSGGNLADMMDRLANVIRDRQRLSRRVRVLTSQTQFSKRVLLALPFLTFVLLNLINPQYMRPLYTTTMGQLIMLVAGTGLMLGWVTMNWISKLSY